MRFPINLATALQLSDASAHRRRRPGQGMGGGGALTRAKLLWVPAPMFGVDYIRHDGGGPDFNKGVITSPSVNYFQVGGSLAVSNPGLFQLLNLTDVFFEPMVARQVLNSRQWDIQIAKNDSLLMTADAYFKVHQYRGMYAGALYVVERAREVVDKVSRLSAPTLFPGWRSTGRGTCSMISSTGDQRSRNVARAQRRFDSGASARPPSDRRSARGGSPSDHTDRPRHHARRAPQNRGFPIVPSLPHGARSFSLPKRRSGGKRCARSCPWFWSAAFKHPAAC